MFLLRHFNLGCKCAFEKKSCWPATEMYYAFTRPRPFLRTPPWWSQLHHNHHLSYCCIKQDKASWPAQAVLRIKLNIIWWGVITQAVLSLILIKVIPARRLLRMGTDGLGISKLVLATRPHFSNISKYATSQREPITLSYKMSRHEEEGTDVYRYGTEELN